MLMVLIAGMGMMQGMAASNTIIQTLVSEDKRGRVMSYYTMAFVGMAPFGSLLAGTHGAAPSRRRLLALRRNGADRRAMDRDYQRSIVVLGAAWFFTRLPALRAVVRPIYQEMGIIPAAEEMAAEQMQS